MRSIAAPVFLLALACAAAAPPHAPLASDFELAVGESVTLPGGGETTLTFVGVAGDSRCPVDVTCVWQGDAEVALRVSGGDEGDRRLTLHTGVEPLRGEVAGLSLRLVELRPRPREGEKIPSERYVAVLRLTRP